MIITRDRIASTLFLSLPGYIAKFLQRFKRSGSKEAASPGLYVPPVYGVRVQYVNDQTPDACPVAAAKITEIREIVGSLHYYAREIDPTMLPAVTAITSDQASLSRTIFPQVNRFLAYSAAYPDHGKRRVG